MTAHAMLSASGSKRWMTCTPSARLEATLPEPKRKAGAFDFSMEGTMAHQLAEAKLRRHYGQITAKEYTAEVNAVKESQYYDDEFEEHIDNYVLYVRSQIGDGDVPLFEQRVDFSDWVPDGFGTADVVILSDKKIRVIDLKFGRGVAVDATDNPQLRLYALGAWNKYKEEYPNIEAIEYTIHQPRLDSITTDHTTLDKLVEWANYVVKPKAKKAWAGQGDFVAGDHCQFCRAKAQCRARSDFNNLAAAADFKEPRLLTEDEMVNVLENASKTRKWLSDVEDYLLNRAKEGGTIPQGYTLGKSSTNRRIQDAGQAAEKLWQYGNDIYEPRTLKSVAQLEKLVGKAKLQELLDDLIVRPEGEPKLVKSKAVEEFS
jgi:hypothetical protein